MPKVPWARPQGRAALCTNTHWEKRAFLSSFAMLIAGASTPHRRDSVRMEIMKRKAQASGRSHPSSAGWRGGEEGVRAERDRAPRAPPRVLADDLQGARRTETPRDSAPGPHGPAWPLTLTRSCCIRTGPKSRNRTQQTPTSFSRGPPHSTRFPEERGRVSRGAHAHAHAHACTHVGRGRLACPGRCPAAFGRLRLSPSRPARPV